MAYGDRHLRLWGVGHLSFIFDITEVVTLVGYGNKYPSTHSQLPIVNYQLSIVNSKYIASGSSGLWR